MGNTPLDDDLHETMARFSAAAHAKPIALPELLPPGRVLVAIDRSNQDSATLAIANEVCRRLNASAVLTVAAPGLDTETRRAYLAEAQGKLDVASEVAPALQDPDPANCILAAKQAAGAKFIVMDAPYLEDIGRLGRDSVGSTAERVLARASVPVLFVREPRDNLAACLGKPLVKLHFTESDAPRAIAEAFRIGGKGRFRVLFVIDAAAIHEAVAILRTEVALERLTDTALLHDAQVAAGSLVATAQRYAKNHGLDLTVDFKLGSEPDVSAREANDGGHLLVLPCPRDRNTAAYSRALTVLRLSTMPVLMV
ncbi:MAG: universal stress protein [Planctomycetes bacterium]|nr:universal stress protein [Planctomycetota bacterium]